VAQTPPEPARQNREGSAAFAVSADASGGWLAGEATKEDQTETAGAATSPGAASSVPYPEPAGRIGLGDLISELPGVRGPPPLRSAASKKSRRSALLARESRRKGPKA